MSAFPCPEYPQPPVTQEMYNALLAKYTSGTREIQYADKRVVFHSLADMWKILQWMESVLYPCSAAGRLTKYAAEYSSGIHSGSGFPENSEIRYR